VCKEKSKGGLGVRDVRLVFLSLLFKWRWHILQSGRPLWKEILIVKYGNHILCDLDWCRYRTPHLVSNWWKNILSLDNVVPSKNWFLDSVGRKVGNGLSTSFWNTKWIGETPFSIDFPRLFFLSNHKEKMVRDFLDGDDTLSFSWHRNLFPWEEDLVASLLKLLEPKVFTLEDDCWRWLEDVDGGFFVKSSYNLLSKELESVEEMEGELVVVLDQIWESSALLKVVAFSWELLLDRIPTRSNIVIRGILALDGSCEFLGCIGQVESYTHLFLHCPSAMKVWGEIFKWLGISVVIPPSLSSLFELAKGSARNVKIRSVFFIDLACYSLVHLEGAK
jgi:hypothetical protein